MPLYREVDPTAVPSETRQAAEQALQYGCAALTLTLPPEVRWCRLVTDQAEIERAMKLTPPDKWSPPGYRAAFATFDGLNDSRHYLLWLRCGMSEHETAITVLHELGHLKRRLAGVPTGAFGSPERAAEEAEVERWAQQQVGWCILRASS